MKQGAILSSSDVEAAVSDTSYLDNNEVQSFTWRDITVTVKDRKTKQDKRIVDGVSGSIQAGELVALMGPSGSGKTTLLNVLAHRAATAKSKTSGNTYIDGGSILEAQMQSVSSYVEQEDTLIGSLTVFETLSFAAKLSLAHNVSKEERIQRINSLLNQLGLSSQAQTIIGTPLRKGISGGQKRRVSVATQLIAAPKILFLDEPTSGLDSAASHLVVKYIKQIAARHRLLVIASIHQPSTSTFELFDKVMLLSGGSTCYYGPVSNVQLYFAGLGHHLPDYTNPAEYIIDLTNLDFEDGIATKESVKAIKAAWKQSQDLETPFDDVAASKEKRNRQLSGPVRKSWVQEMQKPLILLHRGWIKSHRDVVVYGIRIAMYLGLAIMMGTVWLRLPATQSSIQPLINAIFFGSAFMSFMAVAYVPAFLEDRAMYIKEHANGLYGSGSLIVSNFVLGIPYLFLISLLFSIVSYWLSNFRPSGTAFMTWVMWLFLDLVAAESLVVLVSSLVPIFVAALAITAFANGLWMSVGGFMVPPTVLNVFYRYVFHYIDYQSYVFRGMMVNEFAYRTYDCGEGCHCMYDSHLKDQCKIDGNGVLEQYGYGKGHTGKYVGLMLAIIFGLRVLGWLALRFKR